MTFDEIIQVLIDRLGNRPELRTQIEIEIKLAQQNMERTWPDATLPYFLLANDNVFSIPANATTIPVPTNFLKEYDEGQVLFRVQDEAAEWGNWSLAEKWFDEWREVFKFNNGRLQCDINLVYALIGFGINIYPSPQYQAEMSMTYYATQDVLTSAVQNNVWSDYAPELLIAAAGRKLATYIHDQALAQLFAADYQEEMQKLIIATEQRSTANLTMVIR